MQNKNRPQKGTLLISKPLINDGFFEQSVVYITTHDEDGSLGFTLNKNSSLLAQDFMNQLPGEDKIYYGGPVEQDALFYLHTMDTLQGAKPVGNGMYLGGDFSLLQEAITTARMLNLEACQCKFFLGYSGWSYGQLQEEINQGTWIVLAPPYEIDPLALNSEAWRLYMRRLGGEYALWANAPEDPWLN